MSRISAPPFHQLSPDQRRVHDAITAGPRGTVRGPLSLWLHSSELAGRAQSLGEFCRFKSSLPPRLSELAILTTAEHWRAAYEWNAHVPFGLAAGLAETVVEALRTGQRPAFDQEDEQLVYAFTTELLRNHEVSAPTWEHAHSALGTRAVVDLVGVLGYYGLISMTIKAFELAPEPGEAQPFPSRL